MMRSEATLAAIAGKQVERYAADDVEPLRFHPEHGLESCASGVWACEEWNAGWLYRLVVPKPRIFLNTWQEVARFEDAEFAGDADGSRLATRACSDARGNMWLQGKTKDTTAAGYWVKRIEAPAIPVAEVLAVYDEYEYGESGYGMEAKHLGRMTDDIKRLCNQYGGTRLLPTRDELKASQPDRNVVVTGLAEKPQSPAGVPVKEVGDLLYKAPEVVHEAVAQLIEKYGGGK